jgi:U3 small nucleolar RNA-associated protein MPP10
MDNGEDNAELGPILHSLCSEPETVVLSLLSASATKSDQKESLQRELRKVSGALFSRVEALSKIHAGVVGRTDPSSLSGLDDLYTGGDAAEDKVDAETLFGQVDLQNQALLKMVKKSLKTLSSALEDGGVVRLLDEGNSSDEAASDDESDKDASMGDDTEDEQQDDGESEKSDDDEERIRIEARMKRSMEDMDEEDEESEVDNRNKASNVPTDDQESLIDPAAEELNDGFFDINEMEAFADEEEEYLPDEAFGEERPETEGNVDKRSFHQKQRDGDIETDGDDESEDEEDALLFRKESVIHRKRYRNDDEVDALYQLYQNVDVDDDDSEQEDANMTAADLFGKPSRKHYDKWNSKIKQSTKDKSEEDSWDEFDFERGDEQEDTQENTGWNDADMYESKKVLPSEEEVVTDEQVPKKSTSEKSNIDTSSGTGKLKKQTEEIEKEMLAEKPWQMRGETSGTSRPVDSLLDSTPEFEVATKQAPILTVEKTMDLEEVIKKRILEEDWDDVIPRELPDVAWNKKRGDLPEVSQEKSKLGLGVLYEREYMKKALGYDADAVEKETEEEKAKNEIKSLFANLCSKLDALSNYHFAPRPIADEAEIRPVTKPAIAMEEVLPLHVSEARGVAPEEVYGGKRGRESVLRGDSELEQQDRKRMRNAKKAARRKSRKEKAADEKLISKLQPGLGLNNPYEKRKMREELAVARAHGKVTTGTADNNDYGKSGTFFKRMQEEAQKSISDGGTLKKTESDANTKRGSKSNSMKL